MRTNGLDERIFVAGAVRDIVEAHGGAVTITSEHAEGTSVTVTLPAAGADSLLT